MIKAHRKYTIKISEYSPDDIYKFKIYRTAIKTTYIQASETSKILCEQVECLILYVIELCTL